MARELNRRAFLGLSASLAAGAVASGVAGCGNNGGVGGGGGGGVRYFYFGNSELKKSRDQAVALYNKTHKDGQVTSSVTNGADYWDKLAPMVSSGNAPDVLAMNVPYITEYADRDALMDLGPLVSAGTIDVSSINQDLLVPGKMDGKLVSLPMAATTNAITYDTVLLRQTGAQIPGDDWTWDGFAGFAKELTGHLPSGVHGAEDMGANYRAFEIYVLARGEQVYGHSGLTLSRDTVGDWFSLWDGLRKAGGAVPADVSAAYSYSDWPNSPLIKRKCVMQLINSNNYIGVQALLPNELGLHVTPVASAGGPAGQYLFAASYLSLYARTRAKQAAATFLSWLLNSPDAAKILKLASGPPASGKAAAALKQVGLTDVEQRELDYFNHANEIGHLSAPPKVWPKGASQVQSLLSREYQDVSFGRKTVSAAAADFLQQGNSMLAA